MYITYKRSLHTSETEWKTFAVRLTHANCRRYKIVLLALVSWQKKNKKKKQTGTFPLFPHNGHHHKLESGVLYPTSLASYWVAEHCARQHMLVQSEQRNKIAHTKYPRRRNIPTFIVPISYWDFGFGLALLPKSSRFDIQVDFMTSAPRTGIGLSLEKLSPILNPPLITVSQKPL